MNFNVRIKRTMSKLRINPVVLILINVIAPSMYIVLNGRYLQYFLLVFASLLLILMKRYKRLVAMFVVYGLMIGIHSVTIMDDRTKFIGLFFIVLAQSVPCLALASVLVTKYNSAELLAALETLRIPRMMVVAVTITLKYIPTFLREFKLIKESMRLRGIAFTWKKPVSSFQFFVVPQLFRCAALAEEVTAAGMVKGIDAPVRRSSFFEEKVRWSDVALMTIFAMGLAGGFVWQRRL